MPTMSFESAFYFRTLESTVMLAIVLQRKMTQLLMDRKVSWADCC